MRLSEIPTMLPALRWQDGLDIILVTYLLYRFFLLIKGTRAVQLLRGMLLLLLAYLVSQAFQLNTITWLVQSMATMIIVAIPVVFQPEIRRALAHIGQGDIFRGDLFARNKQLAQQPRAIEEVLACVRGLSRQKIGALIVLERQTGLNEFIEAGLALDAAVSAELLSTIFFPNTPLHDGAVIIQGERIAAAGAVLPLSEGSRSGGSKAQYGTRHRAALGLSETTDAIAIVVSEETGSISVATGGQMRRNIPEEALRELLVASYAARRSASTAPFPLIVPQDPDASAKKLPSN